MADILFRPQFITCIDTYRDLRLNTTQSGTLIILNVWKTGIDQLCYDSFTYMDI